MPVCVAYPLAVCVEALLHVEGTGEGNGFCPCPFFAIVSIVVLGMKEHTLCGCCNWLMAFQTMAVETRLLFVTFPVQT